MSNSITLPLKTLTSILVKLSKTKKRVKALVENYNQSQHNLSILRENYDRVFKEHDAFYAENVKLKKDAGTWPDRVRVLADEKRELREKLLRALCDNTSLRRGINKTWEDHKAAEHLLYKVAELAYQVVAPGDEYDHQVSIQKLLTNYAPSKQSQEPPAPVDTQDAPKVEEDE